MRTSAGGSPSLSGVALSDDGVLQNKPSKVGGYLIGRSSLKVTGKGQRAREGSQGSFKKGFSHTVCVSNRPVGAACRTC